MHAFTALTSAAGNASLRIFLFLEASGGESLSLLPDSMFASHVKGILYTCALQNPCISRQYHDRETTACYSAPIMRFFLPIVLHRETCALWYLPYVLWRLIVVVLDRAFSVFQNYYLMQKGRSRTTCTPQTIVKAFVHPCLSGCVGPHERRHGHCPFSKCSSVH